MLRLAIAAAALFLIAATALQAEPAHGIALYGTPKEPPGFTHFPYVNADAPKGAPSRSSASSAERSRIRRDSNDRNRRCAPRG